MSKQQRDALDQMSRHAPLDVGGDVQEQRVVFEKMIGVRGLLDEAGAALDSAGAFIRSHLAQ
jgi:hypothetical protein